MYHVANMLGMCTLSTGFGDVQMASGLCEFVAAGERQEPTKSFPDSALWRDPEEMGYVSSFLPSTLGERQRINPEINTSPRRPSR